MRAYLNKKLYAGSPDQLDQENKLLRKAIGFTALALPAFCALNSLLTGTNVENSISEYYYTNIRDLFVGLLFFTGLFLITYRGPEIHDWVVSSIAGLATMCVAIFPCGSAALTWESGIFLCDPTASAIVHYASASILFALLAYMSGFLFVKSDLQPEQRGRRKRMRNGIYRTASIMMILTMITIGVHHFMLRDRYAYWHVTLFGEALMLVLFGFSWLVKGEFIFSDKERLQPIFDI